MPPNAYPPPARSCAVADSAIAIVRTIVAIDRISDPKLVFQRPDAVAGDAKLCLLLVFQPHEDAAVHPGIKLLDQADVDDRRAMNADEASRIELLLELAERVVDHVLASVRAGERQLVLREKVRDARHIEDCRAVADPRRDPLERTGDRSPRKERRPVPDKLRRELARELTDVGPRLPAQALELVERAIEPLGLDRLQEVVDGIHYEGVDRVLVIRG